MSPLSNRSRRPAEFASWLCVLAVISTVLVGCTGTPTTVDGVTMLRYGFLTGSPAARTGGTIEFLNGCVGINHGDGWTRVVIWPSGARLESISGDVAVVLDGSILKAGDPVELGGGGYKGVEDILGLVGTVPDACVAEEYWLATKVLK